MRQGLWGCNFEDVDADKDGKLSKEEVVTYFQNKAKARADKWFAKADADGDGFVIKEEVKRPKKGQKEMEVEEDEEEQ